MSSAESAPGGGQGSRPLKLKAFCQFSYKKWPKFKDLNENLPPRSEADCFARPRPALNFGQWGRPPGPPIAGSATAVTLCRLH